MREIFPIGAIEDGIKTNSFNRDSRGARQMNLARDFPDPPSSTLSVVTGLGYKNGLPVAIVHFGE